MIHAIRGKISNLLPTSIVIETESGLSYLIKISLITSNQIQVISGIGGSDMCMGDDDNNFYQKNGGYWNLVSLDPIKILTVYRVREDSHDLYGFMTEFDRDTFNLLTSVPGLGPSKTMMLMSTYTSEEIHSLIANGDTVRLAKAKGFGKSGAGRIVTELKDKVKSHDLPEEPLIRDGYDQIKKDAVDALVSLGFQKREAEKSVTAIIETIDGTHTVESLIKTCLKS